jgi:hypothetical protein
MKLWLSEWGRSRPIMAERRPRRAFVASLLPHGLAGDRQALLYVLIDSALKAIIPLALLIPWQRYGGCCDNMENRHMGAGRLRAVHGAVRNRGRFPGSQA